VTSASVDVGGERPYRVVVAPGCLAEAAGLAAGGRAAVLTDANVAPLHLAALVGLEDAPRLVVPAGEASKSLATLGRVLDFLAESDLDRSSALVLLGGGVVGDLGGLAASLYMRGIDAVHCPTSLVAQVDSSIGGKTAIDLAAGKNLAGTFHPPRAVLADVTTLSTLPDAELSAGLGEVLKTALVGDGGILERLDEGAEAVLAREPSVLVELVTRCVRVKAAIVERDERERGERRKLNLGHTFGHAIERAAGYGRVPHGVAVAVGTTLALEAARTRGLLQDPELPARVARIAARLGLPASLAELRERSGLALDPAELERAMRHDKKGSAGEPRFVLPRAAGAIETGVRLAPDELRRLLA